MPVPAINNGDSEATVKTKILNILTYHGVSTSGITSWGVARSRLNDAANLVLLPQVEDGDGNAARLAINAISQSVAASDPVNTVLPVITGVAAFGQVLSVSSGTWTGYPTPTYTYQWKRNGINISGATNNVYTLVNDDIGQVITASVTATNTGGSTVATSNSTANVVAAPVNTAIPVISGVAAMGQILTTTNGTWTGYPVPTYTYQWKADGVNIGGAINNNFTLTASELGKVITVSVTATNSQGNAVSTSNPTAAVVSIPVNTAIPVISGSAISGQTLSSSTGSWNAYPVPTYTYQWKSDGVNISGATNNTFLLTDTQAGTNITVTVTATNSEGATPSTSNMTAIVKPSWMTEDLNLFADFANNRYWKDDVVNSSIIADTHPQSILVPDGSGGWVSRGVNVLSDGPLGLQTVPTRTNGIRNNGNTGTVVGAPGTLPTNWAASLVGLTREVVSIGTENGLVYSDHHFSGTSSGTLLLLYFDTATGIAASVGQLWTASLGLKVVAAPTPPVSYGLRLHEYASGAASSNNTATIAPTGTMAMFQVSRTLTDPAVTAIRPGLTVTLVSGQPYDFTVRIYQPQCELGAFATPPILTTNAAVLRTGNQQVISGLTTQLTTGVSGYVKFNQISDDSSSIRVFSFSDGTANNTLFLYRSGATWMLRLTTGGVIQADISLGATSFAVGTNTLVFAASSNFVQARKVGLTAVTADTSASWPTLTESGIGGASYNTTNNNYQLAQKIGLKFGAQDQASFDAMYAIAAAA